MFLIFIIGLFISLILNFINYDKLYKVACKDLESRTRTLSLKKKIKPEDYNFNISVLSPFVCMLMTIMVAELYNTLSLYFDHAICYFIITSLMLVQIKRTNDAIVSWITFCIEVIVLMYTNVNILATLKLIVNIQLIQIQKHAYKCMYIQTMNGQSETSPLEYEEKIQSECQTNVKIRIIIVQPATGSVYTVHDRPEGPQRGLRPEQGPGV